jgi:hypothetical protein
MTHIHIKEKGMMLGSKRQRLESKNTTMTGFYSEHDILQDILQDIQEIPTFYWPKEVDRPGKEELKDYHFVDLSDNGRIYNYTGRSLTDRRMTIAAMNKLPIIKKVSKDETLEKAVELIQDSMSLTCTFHKDSPNRRISYSDDHCECVKMNMMSVIGNDVYVRSKYEDAIMELFTEYGSCPDCTHENVFDVHGRDIILSSSGKLLLVSIFGIRETIIRMSYGNANSDSDIPDIDENNIGLIMGFIGKRLTL